MSKAITKEELQKILQNKKLRQHLAYEDPLWFSLIYLRHYFEYPFAPFHGEMFQIMRDPKYKLIVVMAFRGSGKSTIMNMANTLWSILGKPQKKCVVIVSQTLEQAKNHFTSIKDELLSNDLLREDFGPYTENEGEWKKIFLDLIYHGSKIQSVSWETSVRGIKHGSIRPDLIICDDLEDSSARTDKIKREELYARFVSEILPLGSKNTKIIVLGNLICKESLIMQLKNDIRNNQQDGIFRAYPIIDNDRRILWPEKYKNIEEIKEIWRRLPRDVWAREYVLKVLGSNENGKRPHVLINDVFGDPYDPACEKNMRFPRQKHVLPKMKKFNISPPGEESISFVYSSKYELEYWHNFGNIFLDEPMLSQNERIEKIKR